MFGIGLSELIIIGIVALLVVGPEKLPEMATKLGRFIWDLRRSWDEVRDTVRSEMMNIKQPFDEIRKAGLEAGEMVKKEAQKIKDEVRAVKTETEASLKEAVEKKPEEPAAAAVAATPAAETVSAPQDPEAEPVLAGPQPAAAAAPGPQPFRRRAPAPPAITYYDLDGNPVAPPERSDETA